MACCLKNWLNNRTATKKNLGFCFCVTFWLSKASHSVGCHNGEKIHHHLA